MGNETKTVISVECIDQTLRMTQAPTIASGGVKENAVEFTFGALWDDLILFAVFYRKPSEVYHVRIEDGRCIVPREVTRNPGCFFLGVMGAKDGVTRTSTVLSYRVEAGAITDGIEPPEPTPSIYAQILASVQSAEQIAQSVRDDADAGKFNGAKGEKGDTGAQGVQGVQGIQGVKGEPGKDGVSPSVEISRSGDTTTIAITDASGVHTAGIKDGSKGDKGDKGDPGAPGMDGSDASVTAENVEKALGYKPVQDVQVNGKSVLANGIANVPIAEKESPGVIKVDDYSIGVTQNGYLFLYDSRLGDIDARSANIAISPYGIDYAVKAAMCDGKGAEWTANEQKSAQKRMGIAIPQIDDASVSPSAPWSSRQIVDALCPSISATGNPVVCYPVAGYPLDAAASWMPRQEGSGDPGFKNLIDIRTYTVTARINGDTLIIPGKLGGGNTVDGCFKNIAVSEEAIYTFSYVHTGFDRIVIQVFDSDHSNIGASDVSIGDWTYHESYHGYYGAVGSGKQIVIPAGVASIDIYFCLWTNSADNSTYDKIMLEKGASATAYAPYANIRPIHGLTSVTVTRCSANILHYTPPIHGFQNGITYDVDGDRITLDGGTPTGSVYILLTGGYESTDLGYPPMITPGQKYSLSRYVQLHFYKKDGTAYCPKATTFIAPPMDDVKTYGIFVSVFTSESVSNVTVQPTITVGENPATYEASYKGASTTLTLSEEVYGGKVDIATGEGTNEWAYMEFDGTEPWYYNTGRFFLADAIPVWPENGFPEEAYSSHAKYVQNIEFNGDSEFSIRGYDMQMGWVGFSISSITTVEGFKAWAAAQYAAGTPIQVVYRRSAPALLTTTGQQSIAALPGVNIIQTDADTVTVTGRADPIHVISTLTDRVAALETAAANA